MGVRYIPSYICDVEGCTEQVLLEKKPNKGMAFMVKDQEVVDMPKGWMKIHSDDFSGYMCPTHASHLGETLVSEITASV